eukprot:scaffold130930_cov63-Phaeocystis_antarctica.AAC.3
MSPPTRNNVGLPIDFASSKYISPAIIVKTMMHDDHSGTGRRHHEPALPVVEPVNGPRRDGPVHQVGLREAKHVPGPNLRHGGAGAVPSGLDVQAAEALDGVGTRDLRLAIDHDGDRLRKDLELHLEQAAQQARDDARDYGQPDRALCWQHEAQRRPLVLRKDIEDRARVRDSGVDLPHRVVVVSDQRPERVLGIRARPVPSAHDKADDGVAHPAPLHR